MKMLKIFFLFLFLPSFVFAKPSLDNIQTYGNVYKEYNSRDLKKLEKFDLVTIEAYDLPNKKFVRELHASGTIVLSYLDIGEAEEWRKYYKKIPRDLILQENPNWKGNFFVNVNDVRWHNIILNQEIPYLLSRGNFGGLMLDMLDAVDEYPNLKPGIISLVKKIHKKYPNLLIVPNRGFTVLAQIAPYIDAFKYEEMCSKYDFENKKYAYKKVAEDQGERKILFKVLKKHKIPVLVLDHVQTQPKNVKMARECFKQAKELTQKTGYKFIWYANSINQDLLMWKFLDL